MPAAEDLFEVDESDELNKEEKNNSTHFWQSVCLHVSEQDQTSTQLLQH